MSNKPRRTVCGDRAVMLIAAISVLIAAVDAQGQGQPNPLPRVNGSGPSLRFDFPGMKIGIAEYDEGPTGTTVFYFPDGVKGAVDVRGGAPGTLNAPALRRVLVRAVGRDRSGKRNQGTQSSRR